MKEIPIWDGERVLGWVIVDSEERAQSIKTIQRAKGFRVKIIRKYERILGVRVVRVPYSARVYWRHGLTDKPR